MRSYRNLLGIAAASLILASSGAFAQSNKPPQMTTAGQNSLVFDTTPDDHSRLKEIFGNEHSAQRVRRVKFSLTPGSVVPGSIRLAPLPQTVINIQPTWQGSDYFRVGQKKVVIVDPQTKEIEGVLTL